MPEGRGAAVVVHHLGHVRRAIDAAGALGCPVTLLSAPGGAATLGPAVFREMVAAGVADASPAPPSVDAVIDCGADPGYALRAIREGSSCIRIEASDDVVSALSDIAEQAGAAIATGTPPALDLDDGTVSDADLDAWLAGEAA